MCETADSEVLFMAEYRHVVVGWCSSHGFYRTYEHASCPLCPHEP